MQLSTHRELGGGPRCVLRVAGEIDYATSADLRTAILDLVNGAGVTTIVLDLRDVTFCDSIGIGTLVVASRICGQVGLDLQLRGPNPFLMRLLHVAGVGGELTVVAPSVPAQGRLQPEPV